MERIERAWKVEDVKLWRVIAQRAYTKGTHLLEWY
jgi:hypothetical protein